MSITAAITAAGCSPKGAGRDPFGLLGTASSHIQIGFPLAGSANSASRVFLGGTTLAVPGSFSQFDCFAVNVVAADIPTTPACGGTTQMGIAGGFLGRGASVDLNVPIGHNRTFQVWGFANSSYCPDVITMLGLPAGTVPQGLQSPGFLLGQKTVDVMQTTLTIDIPVSYTLATSPVICGSLPSPSTSIAYARLNPGTETTSLSKNQVTSSTQDVCIGYTTTATSPVFTCVADGTAVPCNPSACRAYPGGYVHRFASSVGAHTFTVKTVDNSDGMPDPSPPSFSWVVDNVSPTLALSNIVPSGLSGGTYYASQSSVSAILNLSKAAPGTVAAGTIYVAVNGGAASACATTANTSGGTLTCPVTGLAAGASALSFTATDVAGNTSAAVTANVYVDTTAPAATITPSDGWLWGGDLTSAGSPNAAVPGESDDTVLVASKFLCTVDGGSSSACPASFTLSGKGGKHSVTASAQDYAGNSASTSLSVFIDSLLALPVLGRLKPDGSYLQDESAATNVVAGWPLDAGLNSPGQTALDVSSGYLYVTDTNNNRVLVFPWNTLTNQVSSRHAVGVFGQPNFLTTDPGAANGTGYTKMNGPMGVAVANPSSSVKKLFVADTSNNRVLRFDISTGFANATAEAVLGQTAISAALTGANTSNPMQTACTGGAGLTTGFSYPEGLVYQASNNRLYVADKSNCRIAVLTSATTAASGAALAFQLGANNTPLNAASTWHCICDATVQCDANNIYLPAAVALDATGDTLYATDTGMPTMSAGNHRVLGWSSISSNSANYSANVVLGQSMLTSCTDGDTSGATSSLQYPFGVAVVSDSQPNRYVAVTTLDSTTSPTVDKVKLFNTSSGSSVVATWNSATGTPSPSASSFNQPGQLTYIPGAHALLVTDYGFHRVLQFSTASLTDNMAAYDVLGHTMFSAPVTSFNAGGVNNPNDGNLRGPTFAAADTTNNILYVSDTGNNRVLAYALDPSTLKPSNPLAIGVLGVPNTGSGGSYFLDANQGTPSVGPNTLYQPKGLAIDKKGQLWVADSGNNRVVRFPTPGSSLTGISGLSANLIFGQSSPVASGSGSALTQMNTPTGIAYDVYSGRIFVADSLNYRVLDFEGVDTSTVVSGAAANYRLGTGVTGNGTTQFGVPQQVSYTPAIAGDINTGLFVTDSANNSVDYFDLSNGISMGLPATACYGHRAATLAAMCSATGVNDGGGALPTANGAFGFDAPSGVFMSASDKRLYVSDTSNNRVVVYDFTNAVNQPANPPYNTSVNYHVLGAQNQSTTNYTAGMTAIPAAVATPNGILRLTPSSGPNLLYIVDPTWHRVGVYEVP